MTYTSYIIEKYNWNDKAVLCMKSFENEIDAYSYLGEKLFYHYEDIFEWIIDGEDTWGNMEYDPIYKKKISENWELTKKFVIYFNKLQHYATTEEPSFIFGVKET